MSNISGKYAIVGVAETKVGKRPDASTHSLHLECIKACLDDAGITAAVVVQLPLLPSSKPGFSRSCDPLGGGGGGGAPKIE